jgi:hydrogenase maturation factor
MAEASSLGVRIHEERIDVQPLTMRICEFFDINPLRLVSSGALLISVDPKSVEAVIENLKMKRIHASVIGEFLQNTDERRVVRKNGEAQDLLEPTADQLWIALEKQP